MIRVVTEYGGGVCVDAKGGGGDGGCNVALSKQRVSSGGQGVGNCIGKDGSNFLDSVAG
jgi:hypothetical protein